MRFGHIKRPEAVGEETTFRERRSKVPVFRSLDKKGETLPFLYFLGFNDAVESNLASAALRLSLKGREMTPTFVQKSDGGLKMVSILPLLKFTMVSCLA